MTNIGDATAYDVKFRMQHYYSDGIEALYYTEMFDVSYFRHSRMYGKVNIPPREAYLVLFTTDPFKVNRTFWYSIWLSHRGKLHHYPYVEPITLKI